MTPGRKPSEARKILVGGLVFVGGVVFACGGFFAFARLGRVVSSAVDRASHRTAEAWNVSESAVADALHAGSATWRTTDDGGRTIESVEAGASALITPSDDGSGPLALAITIVAREPVLERMVQAERLANALRVAAPEWIGARGYVRALALGENPVDLHIPGYLVLPSASVGTDGRMRVTIAIGRERGPVRPDWMAPSTWDATVWAQNVASASEWADDACFLASRCVFADPFAWHGDPMHFPPAEFGSCDALFGELCRQAVAETDAIQAPGPLASSWTRMLQGHRQTLRDLERIHELIERYRRVELRPDGDGFEDYSAWLTRRDRAAGEAWFNEWMASRNTASDGRVEFREWFAERMCFPHGPARGDQVFAATRRRLPEWRTPLRPDDPTCPGAQ